MCKQKCESLITYQGSPATETFPILRNSHKCVSIYYEWERHTYTGRLNRLFQVFISVNFRRAFGISEIIVCFVILIYCCATLCAEYVVFIPVHWECKKYLNLWHEKQSLVSAYFGNQKWLLYALQCHQDFYLVCEWLIC